MFSSNLSHITISYDFILSGYEPKYICVCLRIFPLKWLLHVKDEKERWRDGIM